MAEENKGQEKTEEASEHKLRKTRREGQVTRSKDVSTMVSLLATLLLLKVSADFMFGQVENVFASSFISFPHSEVGPEDVGLILATNIVHLMTFLLPLLLTPVLVVIFALIPGGWVFASKNFTPQLSRIDPIKGLGRMVSLQNFTELLKSIFKIAFLLVVAVGQIYYALPQLMQLQRGDAMTAIQGSFSLAFNLALSMLLVFLVFAIIDVPLQRFLFLKKMRMTKQERKEEHKTQEGRPEVKAKVRQLQQQIAHRQISKVMKDADVVVANPVHYAVAIKYDVKKAQAPYVIAKGTDETALYIRQLAGKYELEVVELPPLARAIYYSTQVNQQIPVQLYTAVAHVLSYIVQLKAWRRGRRDKPRLATNLPIPGNLANRARP